MIREMLSAVLGVIGTCAIFTAIAAPALVYTGARVALKEQILVAIIGVALLLCGWLLESKPTVQVEL